MVELRELETYCNELLDIGSFQDYSPTVCSWMLE